MIKQLQTLLPKRFTGDVLWNIASLGFLAVGGLLMNGLIMKFRGPDALGVFNQVYAIYIVLSQIGVGGLQHSVLRHISYNQSDIKTCANSTASALVLILLITIPISTAGIMLANPVSLLLDSPPVRLGLIYIMPSIVFFAANKVLINVLNGLKRMRVYAVFRSLRFVLIPVFVTVLILFESQNATLSLALTFTEIVLFLALLIYIYTSILPIQFPRDTGRYIRMHLSYGFRGVLSGVFTELNTRIDVIMLGIFLSDQMVGIYSFAAIFAEGFAQIPMAVRYNVDPLLGEYFSSDKPDRINQLSREIRRVFLPTMTALGLLSMILYPVIYKLAASTAGLEQSWIVFAIFTGVHIAASSYSPFRGLLLQGNKPGVYTLIIITTTITNILLNALLINRLNILGAAIGTGGSILLEILLIILLSRYYFKLKI